MKWKMAENSVLLRLPMLLGWARAKRYWSWP